MNRQVIISSIIILVIIIAVGYYFYSKQTWQIQSQLNSTEPTVTSQNNSSVVYCKYDTKYESPDGCTCNGMWHNLNGDNEIRCPLEGAGSYCRNITSGYASGEVQILFKRETSLDEAQKLIRLYNGTPIIYSCDFHGSAYTDPYILAGVTAGTEDDYIRKISRESAVNAASKDIVMHTLT